MLKEAGVKKVLVPMADGFEEIETVTVVDILRRAGVEVVTAGIRPGLLTGSRGVRVQPDAVLGEIKDAAYDLIVLPGGQPGVDNLRRDPDVLSLLKKRHERKDWIGAICAAPLALRDAGITRGVTLTSYPAVESQLSGVNYRQDRVVVDGHFVTSRSPGTALEFALKLVEILCGPSKASEISGQVLARSA